MEPKFGWIHLSKKEKVEKYLKSEWFEKKSRLKKDHKDYLHQHHTKLLQIFVSEVNRHDVELKRIYLTL